MIIGKEELAEVANFQWNLFEPLVNGGTIQVAVGMLARLPFVLKKSETNPLNLPYPDYFMQDAAHAIPEEFKTKWPKTYRGDVESFERFPHVTQRIMATIKQASECEDDCHFIFVTHDCMTMYLADKFTGGRQKGLAPATSMALERKPDGRIVVTRVGDITDGDNETDFVKEFLSLG